MTVEHLANIELELYSTVLELNKQKQTDNHYKKLEAVFAAYRRVHKHYSELAKEEDEALKRGLFLQWYANTEPNYLTGIGELDEGAEEKIIDFVENKIQNKCLDIELSWMLNYYVNWDYAFDKFKNRKGLAKIIENRIEGLPKGDFFEKVVMNKRGQMGIYWNSLKRNIDH